MKFLCDQMLVRLGKWLRAAGYDTMIIQKSMLDNQVLELALKEERCLITRDKDFQKMKNHPKVNIVYLKQNSTNDLAA